MVMVRNLNPRIDTLSRQCWRGTYFDFERFAELIVEDCVAQVALIGISNFDNDDVMWATETAIQNIQTLFAKPVEYDHYSDLPKPEAYSD